MNKQLLFLLLSPMLLFPQEMSKENQEFKDIVMKYAYQYLSPMHIKVLEENYSGPESYFSVNRETGERYRRIYDEISDEIVLREIEVGVHESTHLVEYRYPPLRGPCTHVRSCLWLRCDYLSRQKNSQCHLKLPGVLL